MFVKSRWVLVSWFVLSGVMAAHAADDPPKLPTVPLPADEALFLKTIEEARAAYDAAPNEMARGATRPARMRRLCAIQPSPKVRAWVGTVEMLSSTSKGNGVLAVRLSEHVLLHTWNIETGDVGTLIQVGGKVFEAVSAMKAGAVVSVSGRLIQDDEDCFRETSVFVYGGMHSPDFLFRFDDVKLVGQ